MLLYFGLTEIVGEPGSGKTVIAIEESKLYKTLYLTSTNFPIDRYDFTAQQFDTITIKLVQSTTDLLFVLNFSVKHFIANSLELLVVDDLFHIIFVDKRSRKETTGILYRLKKLIQMHGLKVLVVITSCTSTYNKNRVSFISKLGLNWEYHVNTKYRVLKEGESHLLELTKAPIAQEFFRRFKIHRTHLEVIDKIG